MGSVLIIVLVLVLLGVLPTWNTAATGALARAVASVWSS